MATTHFQISFLAVGCGISPRKMQTVFDAERSGKRQLVPFLSEHFNCYRLLGEERTHPLTSRYGHFIERKSECA